MKKLISSLIFSALVAAGVNAQVMSSSGMKNTTWSGFGVPSEGDFCFYGFSDALQARLDYKKITVEGMLNWGFTPAYKGTDVDNFVFGIMNDSPLGFHYGAYQDTKNTNDEDDENNMVNRTNTYVDPFYVNFFWNLNKNFVVGMGTKLNWGVGAAPGYGDFIWQPNAHVTQGGFSTAYDDRSGSFMGTTDVLKGHYQFNVDRPGSADVVGFVHYANRYAKSGVGIKYETSNDNGFHMEIGTALPNGFNTGDPAINLGVEVSPVKWMTFALAFEGLFDDKANFFTSASFGFDAFRLDAYLAMDSLFTKADDDEAYGTGAAITFTIPKTAIVLRPEAGLNFFQDSDYSMAFYSGCGLTLPINKTFEFLAYSSIAFGSKDKDWSSDYTGGNIFTARPQIKIHINNQTTVDAYLNFENRHAFDDENRAFWSSGVYLTYVF